MQHLCSDEAFELQQLAVRCATESLTLKDLNTFSEVGKLHRPRDGKYHTVFLLQPVQPMKPAHCWDNGMCLRCEIGQSAMASAISDFVKRKILPEISGESSLMSHGSCEKGICTSTSVVLYHTTAVGFRQRLRLDLQPAGCISWGPRPGRLCHTAIGCQPSGSKRFRLVCTRVRQCAGAGLTSVH